MSGTTPQLPGVLHTLQPTLNHYGYLAVGGLDPARGLRRTGSGRDGADPCGGLRRRRAPQHLAGGPARVPGRGHRRQHRLRDRPLRRAAADRACGRYILLTPERLRQGDRTSSSAAARASSSSPASSRGCVRPTASSPAPPGCTGRASCCSTRSARPSGWGCGRPSVTSPASHIDSIYSTATRYSVYFGIAVGVLLIAYIAWRIRRSRREHAERAERANQA